MSAEALESALAALVRLGGSGHRPGHHLAREVLLALGERLRIEGVPARELWLERVRAAAGQAGPAWVEAVETELSMACGEFVQCLDPRFLEFPRYDVEYTRAARSRLEDRIQAARALGFDLAPREAEMVRLADLVLASFLEKRGL